MLPNLQETADLVTFTEEILNGKLHFLCSDIYVTTLTLIIYEASIFYCLASLVVVYFQ